MNKGCLLFAHDGDIDYGSQAVLAGELAKKHLGVPVTLAADKNTIANIKSKFFSLPFEQIIEIPLPQDKNSRWLTDGSSGEYKEFNFLNGSRASAFDITPYDRTLVIDTDFLIFSNTLGKFWNSDYEFLITPGMLELQNINRTNKISTYSVEMMWATNIMFSKTPSVKVFFDLIDHIKQEYVYYSHVYHFDKHQFRNDHAFSIACHIMSGEGLDMWQGLLPKPLWFLDTDQIQEIKNNGQITFFCRNYAVDSGYALIKAQNQDLHCMNKLDLLRNLDNLLGLI